MQSQVALKGSALLVALAAGAVFCPLPTDLVGFLLLATGILILERFAVALDLEHRYSPAAALYVGGAAVPAVGPGLLGALLVVETALRRKGRTFDALVTRFPEAASLLVMFGLELWGPDIWWVTYLVGPTLLTLLMVIQATHTGRRLKGKDRLQWLRARLRLRPLEATLGAASLLVAGVVSQSPWFLLPLIPLLASTRYAAESIVLRAQDTSTTAVLSALKQARGRSRRVSQALAHAQTHNQIMEGFTAHLAGSPNLQDTCGHLLATLEQLVAVDDAVVFLTPNPGTDAPVEPFLYNVQPEHEERLQGVALTRLQEPIVERCWRTKKALEEQSQEPGQRLLRENSVGAAVPLGEFGVLYAGRQAAEMFSGQEKQRLRWLCDKARLAFDAAFRAHNLKQEQVQTTHRVRTLEHRVTLLGNLIGLAEAVASTLEMEKLADRLGQVLGQSMECDHCLVLFHWDEQTEVRRAWGLPGGPESTQLLDHVRSSGLPLLIDSFEESDFNSPARVVKSAICAPLTAHEKTCGAVLLGSTRTLGFSKEALEQLRLMAYQAGMAFSNARLFHQVVLARRQLEESQQTLIQQSKLSAIGKLAAGVAHELNTPLGIISLSLEEARDNMEEMPDFSRKMIEKALKAVNRSRTITDTMLAHSRNPSGEKSKVLLHESITETLQFLSFEVKNSHARLETELAPIALVCWPQDFHQVMVNLCLNALQAMEEKPPAERVLRVRTSRTDGEVRIEVADRGKGMTAEEQERAFEPFYTTKPVGKGTGLGLWVSLQFVEKLGGTIEIESELDRGTLIRVRIPVATEKKSPAEVGEG